MLVHSVDDVNMPRVNNCHGFGWTNGFVSRRELWRLWIDLKSRLSRAQIIFPNVSECMF